MGRGQFLAGRIEERKGKLTLRYWQGDRQKQPPDPRDPSTEAASRRALKDREGYQGNSEIGDRRGRMEKTGRGSALGFGVAAERENEYSQTATQMQHASRLADVEAASLRLKYHPSQQTVIHRNLTT